NLMQAGISKVYAFKLDKDSENKKLLVVVTDDGSKPIDPKPIDPKPDNTMLPYPKNVVETTIGELGMLSSSLDLASSMSLSTD
ncbi:hypothetical protein ACHJH3_11290, partial [Campylobacter sp. MOP7]|uniref:hypothetical protein n=1 Tax=Campylobacter canis TaxID=3378588 RepID=UPI00387E6B01